MTDGSVARAIERAGRRIADAITIAAFNIVLVLVVTHCTGGPS